MDRLFDAFLYIKDNWKFILSALALGFCFSQLLTWDLVIAKMYNSYNCSKRWNKSNYTSKYDNYAGCLISKDNKNFTPERTIRENLN